MTYREAFPEIEASKMPPIPDGWVDISWRGARFADACPQFIAFGERDRERVVVTINWEDRCGCGQDYIATHYNADEEVEKDFGSDDFAEVLATVEAWEKVDLAEWYVATIGYDPFLDDPSNTVADIREVKREYIAAIEAGE